MNLNPNFIIETSHVYYCRWFENKVHKKVFVYLFY